MLNHGFSLPYSDSVKRKPNSCFEKISQVVLRSWCTSFLKFFLLWRIFFAVFQDTFRFDQLISSDAEIALCSEGVCGRKSSFSFKYIREAHVHPLSSYSDLVRWGQTSLLPLKLVHLAAAEQIPLHQNLFIRLLFYQVIVWEPGLTCKHDLAKRHGQEHMHM